MEYKCGICGKHLEHDLMVYVNHTQAHIIDEIQADHPDWVEKDGLCRKCVEYYREQMRGDSSKE